MKLKRIISIILSLMLIISAVSAIGFAEETAGTAEETAGTAEEAADAAETTEEEAAAGEEAETPAETSEPEVVYGEDAIGLLNVLEITEMIADELGDTITRADFLMLIGAAAGCGEASSSEQLFSDLPLDDEREPYVRALYNLGIISTDSSMSVYPDAEIGMAEAAAIAVKLTGYSLVAESRGGYPAGYLSVAKMNDILSGLPSSQYTVLTKGMAAKLTLNTLKANVMVQTGFGSGSSYEEGVNNSLLGSLYDVYEISDVVTGIDVSRLIGENDVEAFHAVIGDVEISAYDVPDIHKYLGYNVDAYYKYERGDYPKLIHVVKNEKNNETIIDINDISVAGEGRIEAYDEDGNTYKTYSFKRSLPVIYNSVATKQYFSEDMIDGKYGNIRLLDNTGDKGADVIFADVYENYVVSYVDTANDTIYDQYDNTKKLVLDLNADDPYTNIYDSANEAANLSKIQPGSVVSVFTSAPDAYQGYINAYIIGSTTSGIIEKVKSGGKSIIVNGIEYETTAECLNEHKDSLSAGQTVTLKFDYNGNVADIVVGADGSALQYGFIMSVDAGSGLRGNLKLKIFRADGVELIAGVGDSVRIDAETYKSEELNQILTRLKTASEAMFGAPPEVSYSSIIRFSTDEEGNLKVIDTVLDSDGNPAEREGALTDGDSLFVNYESQAQARDSVRVGTQLVYNSSTEVLMFPSPASTYMEDDVTLYYDMNDPEYYESLMATGFFQNEKKYDIFACFTSADQYVANFAGCVYSEDTAGGDVSYFDQFAVVSKEVGEIYDQASDEIRDFITINGSAEISAEKGFTFTDDDGDSGFPAKMTLKDLKIGDIIKYKLGRDGLISDIQFVFRTDPMTEVDRTSMERVAVSSQAVRYGFVYEKYDSGMLIYFPNDTEKGNFGAFQDIVNDGLTQLKDIKAKECEIVTATDSPVFLKYEILPDGEPETGTSSLAEIKAYKDVGEDCSKVMFISTGVA